MKAYNIEDTIIHDNEAMWDLACTLKSHYKFLKEQVIQGNQKGWILVDGNVVPKWDERFAECLDRYKKELEYLTEMLQFGIGCFPKFEHYYDLKEM